jgi:hypothetical protein
MRHHGQSASVVNSLNSFGEHQISRNRFGDVKSEDVSFRSSYLDSRYNDAIGVSKELECAADRVVISDGDAVKASLSGVGNHLLWSSYAVVGVAGVNMEVDL